MGPCEAGVRTAQEQGQGETSEKRPCNSVSGAEWHDGPRGLLAFLAGLSSLSFSCSRSSWVVPGAEFLGIPTKTLSKVKHIARPACRPALKSTASHPFCVGVLYESTRTSGRTPSTVRPWARGFCPHGRPGPLGLGLCGRLTRHGVGGFMFNSPSSANKWANRAVWLSRGPRALVGLPFSVWTGACYWHGVGGSVFNSQSFIHAERTPAADRA